MKRRKIDAEVKMAAVLEALRGESTIAEICRKNQISNRFDKFRFITDIDTLQLSLTVDCRRRADFFADLRYTYQKESGRQFPSALPKPNFAWEMCIRKRVAGLRSRRSLQAYQAFISPGQSKVAQVFKNNAGTAG
jgi:N12 class adenine-specific DNA methylase